MPVKQVMHVRSQGWDDRLEKGMATHSSILAWRIPWTEEPGGVVKSPWGRKKSDMMEQLTPQLFIFIYIDYFIKTSQEIQTKKI